MRDKRLEAEKPLDVYVQIRTPAKHCSARWTSPPCRRLPRRMNRMTGPSDRASGQAVSRCLDSVWQLTGDR